MAKRGVRVSCVCKNPACGKTFEYLASRIKLGEGIYCSSACFFAYKKAKAKPRSPTSVCLDCGKTYETPKWDSSGVSKFCSRSCARRNSLKRAAVEAEAAAREKVFKAPPIALGQIHANPLNRLISLFSG